MVHGFTHHETPAELSAHLDYMSPGYLNRGMDCETWESLVENPELLRVLLDCPKLESYDDIDSGVWCEAAKHPESLKMLLDHEKVSTHDQIDSKVWKKAVRKIDALKALVDHPKVKSHNGINTHVWGAAVRHRESLEFLLDHPRVTTRGQIDGNVWIEALFTDQLQLLLDHPNVTTQDNINPFVLCLSSLKPKSNEILRASPKVSQIEDGLTINRFVRSVIDTFLPMLKLKILEKGEKTGDLESSRMAILTMDFLLLRLLKD